MTDYWISSKKHYCEVCKIWISGHPINIKTHENSPKHLTAVRDAIIDSHKREKDRQKAEEFEKEELARLEKIASNDFNDALTCILDDLPNQRVPPPLIPIGPTRNEEIKRLEEFYASKLKDKNTETNGLISNTSELEKKLELELGPEWKKKYDPIRKIKYFHNEKTGKVRLVTENIVKPKNVDDNVTSNIITINNDNNNNKSKPAITISIKSKAESNENKSTENMNKDIEAPVIGSWEVVTEQSAFNLPVHTQVQESNENDTSENDSSDSLEDVAPKPIFINNNKNCTSFAKRDISSIKKQKTG